MKILINDGDAGINNITTLINKVNFVFKSKNKAKKNYEFIINPKKIDAVSALVIYKIFEYSFKNTCLDGPIANLDYILRLFSKYGIEDLFHKLINQQEVEKLYKKLKPIRKDNFFIAPHAINRTNFKNKMELENRYTKFIADYYEKVNPDMVQYIKTCLCEIASNFLYHAIEDDNSILMAHGDQHSIEIVCVDNSKGFISNYNRQSRDHRKTLKNLFNRGVSSKKEYGHCGTGLWLVRKITYFLGGIFKVYTEDVSYEFRSGKVFVRKSPYWFGSIVYLKLNITDCTKLNDFFIKFNRDSNLGLINICN